MSETDPITTDVLLLGGPDDWHEKTLSGLYSAADLAGPREDLGTYLISNGVPQGHSDPGARAVYTPSLDPGMPPHVWFFRGWMPASSAGPEHQRPTAHEDHVAVMYGQWGVPVTWEGPGPHEATRLLAHWEAEEGRPAIWRVRGTGPDGEQGVWEIHEHGDRTTAGRVPDPVEDRDRSTTCWAEQHERPPATIRCEGPSGFPA